MSKKNKKKQNRQKEIKSWLKLVIQLLIALGTFFAGIASFIQALD